MYYRGIRNFSDIIRSYRKKIPINNSQYVIKALKNDKSLQDLLPECENVCEKI